LKTILVIGAGAAGLMAAGTASQHGCKVTLLDKNEKLARKLVITGKGRCNLTNNITDINDIIANIPVNGAFMFGALSRFMPSDTIGFFESLGVPLKTERGGRVFPVSNNSFDVVDALNRFITKNKVKRVRASAASLIIENNKVLGAVTQDGKSFTADAVIIATGGLSYPQTGSTGDGYDFAKQAGHTIIEPKPSLVPLECHEGFVSRAAGLTLKNINLTVTDTHKKADVFSGFGELLITHFGVSGPLVLSASSHMRNMESEKFELHIDLKPALTHEQLDKRILTEISENANKNTFNLLSTLLPKSLIPIVANLSEVNGMLKANSITKEARQRIAATLKDIKLTVIDFRSIDEAVITSGGVSVNEINPKTMESKITKGLYFAGEVIDVDAYTGGFNLQIAFSTGALAGNSVCN
jgi:predicted Rossmann fold flavoprotein